jgi:outer membrane receptor for monomeric catechols
VTVVKFPRIYALDVNNGIVALTYNVPLLPFSITSVAHTHGTGVVLSWQSVSNRTYQVQVASKVSKTTTWSNLGSPILATGATTSYTDNSTNASLNAAYYQVVGH